MCPCRWRYQLPMSWPVSHTYTYTCTYQSRNPKHDRELNVSGVYRVPAASLARQTTESAQGSADVQLVYGGAWVLTYVYVFVVGVWMKTHTHIHTDPSTLPTPPINVPQHHHTRAQTPQRPGLLPRFQDALRSQFRRRRPQVARARHRPADGFDGQGPG